MYSIGIDIGYSSIKTTLINFKTEIKYNKYELHNGKINKTLLKQITEILKIYDSEEIMFGGITGRGANLFRGKTSALTEINSIAALVESTKKTEKTVKAIIEIGGQGARYITGLNESDNSQIKIASSSNCSAGTGSFLEEQISRLNLKLEDYSALAGKAESIPRIAGRCSVFAKTDVTHHLQEGVAVNDILLGLAYSVVKNFKSIVMKKLTIEKPILLAGGVAHNMGIITALKDILKLNDKELIISDNIGTEGASGSAIIALNEKRKICLLYTSPSPRDVEESRMPSSA